MIPNDRIKAVRKHITADKPVSAPISVVERMDVSKHKMKHRYAHQNRNVAVTENSQCTVHKLNNLGFRLNPMVDGPLRSVQNAHRSCAKELPIGSMARIVRHDLIQNQFVIGGAYISARFDGNLFACF